MNVRVFSADLRDPVHQAAIVELLDLYASDLMGRGAPLPEDVKQRLPQSLQDIPHCRVFLAYADEQPVGLCVAFVGFSTFQAKPLLNLHDVAVRPGCRGLGIGRKLLAAAEAEARRLGCCKVTLEVHDDNVVARHLYESYGFAPGTPRHEFWTKPIQPLLPVGEGG